MKSAGERILSDLEAVASERRARAVDPALGARVISVKTFQHDRFARSYADMLAHPRYARAARFFLDDLYGPHDFTARDAQVARVVPALVRLFPPDIVDTVAALSELHALSEQLDTAMARALPEGAISAEAYQAAWCRVGSAPLRQKQIDLMLQVGHALDRLTRNALLRHSLRLMRGPARAAGLSALQTFLETGFDTFRDMKGAGDFLSTIASREHELAARLFAEGEGVAGVFP